MDSRKPVTASHRTCGNSIAYAIVIFLALFTSVHANAQSGNGLKGEYYDNENFTNLKFSRTDASVNFNWDTGSPDKRIASDYFSVRWTGSVYASSTGTYVFTTYADDGVRLWVDGKLLVDDWNRHSAEEHSGQISLVAGRRYNVKLEYFEAQSSAQVGLLWSSPTFNKRPIEQKYLYSATVSSATPTPAPTAAPTPVPTPAPTPTPATDPYAGLPIRDPSTGKLLAFPGAQGFGVTTPGGRGGKIIKVTNLNATGPGSFRAAVEESGPRIVVFEVSGPIQHDGAIRVVNPYLTIAGQTAPSPGITLRGATFEIETHNVLIQHMRFRTGDGPGGLAPSDRDNITLNGNYGASASTTTPKTYNVVIDHCSLSWALDENFSTWYPGVNDITLSNSIIAEGLLNAGVDNGQHSTGMLVGDHTKRVAVIGNFFVHNDGRNPLFKGDTSGIVMNNYIYDPGYAFVEYAYDYTASPMLTSIVGNVFESGPGTKPYVPGIGVWSAVSGTQIYRSDNAAINITSEYSNPGSWVFASQPPLWINGLTAKASSGVKTSVLSSAGARPADRDAVDIRVVNDAKNRTGKLISATSQVGGWPVLAQNYRAFTTPSNPNADDDGDGYTNLEEMLQRMAATVEGRK